MKYDVEYLAGLEIAEKDGRVRLLQVPFAAAPGDLQAHCNHILLALQQQGYEVLQAMPDLNVLSTTERSLWITYR